MLKLTFNEPNRNLAWNDNGRYSFRKKIIAQAKHDFQLNKAVNMQCRSPEQHKSRCTTNSHTGNSTSTSLCTTSSPSFSSVCRRGGEGEGALWFPALWVILPQPRLWWVIPPAPDCLLGREAWLGGGMPWEVGGGGGACDAAPYIHTYKYIYIYIYVCILCTHIHVSKRPNDCHFDSFGLPSDTTYCPTAPKSYSPFCLVPCLVATWTW